MRFPAGLRQRIADDAERCGLEALRAFEDAVDFRAAPSHSAGVMRPEVVVHNTVSLDGCASGFEVDLGLHYEVAGSFETQATLIGSGTARAGLEMFGPGADEEQKPETDASPIDPTDERPLWVLVDSRGSLANRLHHLWGSGYCCGMVVGISESTPRTYSDYLRTRKVEHHVLGGDKVDLARLLELLYDRHGVKRVLVDAGPTLIGVLLDAGLVDRLSLIVAPRLAMSPARLFSKIERAAQLRLVKAAELRDGCVHLEYRSV